MYNKKILELFKKPKNMGEIKNPDGVGRVGNPVCLVPGSLAQSNPSIIPIEKLEVGSEVLSHDGEHNKVSKVFKRNYKGEIFSIKSRLGITKLTPEHLVKAIKIPKKAKYLLVENKKSLIADWYNAKDLERNDIILYPKSKKVVDIDKIKTNITKYKYDFRSKDILESIAVNEDFLRLAGYFIAEGDTRTKICKCYLTLSFGDYEQKYISDVVSLFKKIFDVYPKVKTISHRKTTIINVYNVHISRFFNKLFGKGAANKFIPEFMLFLPPEKQRALIKGLWRGDGFINKSIPRAGFSTISKELAHQLKFLLIRQDIIPSLYIENEHEKDGVKHKVAYRIHVGSWSILRLAELLDEEVTRKNLAHDSWDDENYIYVPITSVISEPYDGDVHNLEVEHAHSYTSDSALLHNCGDVMHVYIKVKDNRIKNIKFKTFGCVAAIATSSIVTELAKGKTLEEAEKITNQDVAKELGGLPKIKIHCSVLAQQALRAAIKDYRIRTKNKSTRALLK